MLILQSLLFLLLSFPLWAADDPAESSDAATQSGSMEGEASEQTQPAEGDSSDASTASDTPITEYEDVPRITPDKAKQRFAEVIRNLKLYQRESEIVEISGNETPLMGLYLPENTGKPQGGVLILHDINQHAHWPHTITPIREYLPDYGWNTLSIFFDQYIEKPLPEVKPFQFAAAPLPAETNTTADDENNPDASDTSAASEEVATENTDPTTEPAPVDALNADTQDNNGIEDDPLDAVANSLDEVPEFTSPQAEEIVAEPEPPIEETFIEDMIARTEQGLQKLNEMGQFNIVIIANGYSANWAAKMLEKRISGEQKGYALILIDAKASTYPPVDLNTSLAKLNIPMLDIITEDAPEQLRISKTRKGAMLREQNKKYMQLFLPAIKPSLSAEDNMIARRIRGWLLTHAAGEEVAVKVKNY
ncbi:MAG: DUF3530 family protein [Gammaproteobacteria bacterium]|nr:DUF3530 family protein [Gammaproteobacteria bacterium]